MIKNSEKFLETLDFPPKVIYNDNCNLKKDEVQEKNR